MRIHVYVEGDSDRDALKCLVDPVIAGMAAGARVALSWYPKHGKPRLLHEVPAAAADVLRQFPEDWVFALPDLHPKMPDDPRFPHDTAAQLRASLRRANRSPRFLPHVLIHDLEALLLACPLGLQKVLRSKVPIAPAPAPEQVNHEKPPKRHVNDLFHRHLKRGYVEVLDGPAVLRGADPDALAQVCPDGFGLFWRDLRSILTTGNVANLTGPVPPTSKRAPASRRGGTSRRKLTP